MGSVEGQAKKVFHAAGGGGPLCLTDYNDLTHNFIREFNLRTHGANAPHCLFIDIEEGGDALRLVSRKGNQSHRILRDRCACFGGKNCDGHPKVARPDGGKHCSIFVPAEEPSASESGTPDDAQYDLVMSCHTISFIANPRAVCFLANLRHSVRPGGMVFVSAFGRYSVLGENYPAESEPLAKRFAPLDNNAAFQLAPETRLCLYSERDLCNTLFEAGWSVIRSSTTTENNVIATAIRV